MREMTQAWLQSRAAVWFDQRIRYFLEKTGLTIRRWRLSSAVTRWGSCTSDGNIMLNWRLIHFSPMVIDYVIAHELAHLREMNHSQDFWTEVQQLYPDYHTAKQMLQRHTPEGVPEI
jgi:predicted metal-dependent hydrolase